jgi:hypothetical protein
MRILLLLLALAVSTSASSAQGLPKALQTKLDSLATRIYATAATRLPCRIKTRGKPPMMRWQQVDRCFAQAVSVVDWQTASGDVSAIQREALGINDEDFRTAVEAALNAKALPFGRVFQSKNEEVLLPLTNSVLKYLPPHSLDEVPVFDKAGDKIGFFAGVYAFETSYRLSLFQYTDLEGNFQTASDRLLLDSYGVPWKNALNQRGFRLPVDLLFPAR